MIDVKFHSSQISQAGSVGEEKLLDLMKAAKLQDICYAFKTRVKPYDKIIEKVKIKQKSKPEYNVGSITDVLGLRVVTLFREDMVNVADTILSLIAHKRDYKPIPFIKDSLKEAIIYTPSVGNDPVISKIIQKINTYEIIPRDEVREVASAARYSSIHLVALLDVQVSGYSTEYRVPVEIQIRTVFEDAWGEIDHKYGYQSRSGKNGDIIQNPRLVQKNLLTLKKFVDSCAEYADNIRDLALDSETNRRHIRALDTDELIIENLQNLNIDQNVLDKYMDLRSQRAQAESSTEGNSISSYMNAVAGFNQLFSQVFESDLLAGEDLRKLFRYYIKMDEALCRLSVDKEEETFNAISIYKDLIKEYPTYPVISFRFGQALLRVSKFEEARKQLKKCRSHIHRLSQFKEDKRKIKLPDIELKRIEVGLYTLLGLAYWKEATEIYKGNYRVKVKQYLEQAFLQTRPGLEAQHVTEKQKITLINNLLFYSLEIVFFKKVNGACSQYDCYIKNYANDLSKRITVSTSENVEQLDTLMNAYLYLDQTNEAIIVAQRLEKIAIKFVQRSESLDPEILKRVTDLLNQNEGP